MKSISISFRKKVIGKNVKNVLLDEEGLGISFVEGWNISVWSAVTLYALGGEVNLCRISELVGASLIGFKGDDVYERLIFSNGFEAIVDLAARSSSQPEAMMVRGPGNLIVVWND